MKPISYLSAAVLMLLLSCQLEPNSIVNNEQVNFFSWDSATVYFLLTDRFHRGDSESSRTQEYKETAVLRGFEGGNFAGITQKINEGYFSDLGVDAIWLSPFVEQNYDSTDEGTGETYAYHGYWTRDWTAIEPNFGNTQDLQQMIEAAHQRGIRIVMDAVLNHTGPVTPIDFKWPDDWVRIEPTCNFQDYAGTTSCTLVANLPDILTDSENEVELPAFLVEKWKNQGRYEEEIMELDAFFERTKYPRTPSYYIVKWLTDYIKEFGINAFRVDTTKHTDEYIWADLKKEAEYSFEYYKQHNGDYQFENEPFYMVGEVYGYETSKGKDYNFGDRSVNYFDFGYDALINFEFKNDTRNDYESLFTKYDKLLHDKEQYGGFLNYLQSHDDAYSFDVSRTQSIKTANALLLSPGAIQIYYGDESARPLQIEGAVGDANLRSNMNWESIEKDVNTQKILKHWKKLGAFRKNHKKSLALGKHQQISSSPYYFSRSTKEEKVIIGLEIKEKRKKIVLNDKTLEKSKWRDAYSAIEAEVIDGILSFETDFETVLLERIR
jgi:alpha-amylase